AVTVPGQKSLAKKGANSDITSLSGLTTALSIAQGGTGAKTANEALTALGALGLSGGTLTNSLNIAGIAGNPYAFTVEGLSTVGSVWAHTVMVNGTPRFRAGVAGVGGAVSYQIAGRNNGTDAFSTMLSVKPGSVVYTSENTTKASDGTLKAASPVARIVKSQNENQRTDIDENDFIWCGCGTANAEAEGIKISRLDVGIYLLTGSAGLASEGWQLLPPMDPAGMGELGIVEAEQTDSGGLTIRLFKRKYILSEEGEIVKTKGAPIDVPANSWIDVRLDMPEDSIWKTKVLEASIAGADSTPE
ncbi:phage tail protein, partial [Enterobacter hormaechei]